MRAHPRSRDAWWTSSRRGLEPVAADEVVHPGDILVLVGTQIAIIVAAILTDLTVNFLLRKLRGR